MEAIAGAFIVLGLVYAGARLALRALGLIGAGE